MSTQHWICECPDLDQVGKVISIVCDGKSPGANGLNPEVMKSGSRRLVELLFIFVRGAWENVEVSVDWKDAHPVTIFKKENRRDCGNYRRISFLSILEEVFGCILFNRLLIPAEDFLLKTQCGFHQQNTRYIR